MCKRIGSKFTLILQLDYIQGETKRSDSMKKEIEKKRKWLIRLIDDSLGLWVASCNGHVRVVEKMILEVVGINVNVADSGGATPMCVASSNGHFETVKVLIAAGGDVYKSLKDGQSPLFMAAEMGYNSLITLLLDAGANNINTRVIDNSPFDPSCSGLTPLGIATQNNHSETIQLLKDAGAQ